MAKKLSDKEKAVKLKLKDLEKQLKEGIKDVARLDKASDKLDRKNGAIQARIDRLKASL